MRDLGLQLFRIGATALSIVTLIILCPFATLAQVLPGFAPLEMLISFLPQILLASTIAAATLIYLNKRLLLFALPIIFITATPFMFFSKYEAPSGPPCAPGECLTVITANIYNLPNAMQDLQVLAEREDADIVAINEAVSGMDMDRYEAVFPDYAHGKHVTRATSRYHTGNPLSLLSKTPFAFSDQVSGRETGRRAYIIADLDGAWSRTRLIATHAMTPLSQPGIRARNALLQDASAALADQETFILMGDFNLTPWSPTFRRLPGKRAGDPRLSNTWPTFFPPLGLSIDHIMFGGDLELVEFRVLESVGSDHYPVLARFRRPGTNSD
ncbi:MAG: endonuclease/exonuclease/phosphatase family protein [Pseudomonadota bacterium]